VIGPGDWPKLFSTSPVNPGKPIPPPPRHIAPPFPLPAGNYFGLITGPNESHGGFYPREQAWVKQIQERLEQLGFAPQGCRLG
jgi:hypothetical protein